MTDTITKKEISWWKGMIIVIVGIVVWGVRLESTVSAMQGKGVKLRSDTENSLFIIMADIKTIKNIQIQIAKELNIDIKY